MQQIRVDSIDLHIVRLIVRGSRTPYKNIASAVGITPSAAKKRINKMVLNSVIHNFVVVVNPVIWGYEKLCFLIVRNIDKTIKEQDLFNRISLLGDIFLSVKPLERAASLFLLFVGMLNYIMMQKILTRRKSTIHLVTFIFIFNCLIIVINV